MTQFSGVEFFTLKDNLLKMWFPVVGEGTVAHVFSMIYAKFFSDLLNADGCLTYYGFQKGMFIEEMLKHFQLEGNIKGFFDTKPPFQLGETILTGSFSEGLFLFLNEPPDMDLMCVLKNITFTQEDQEHGSLSFREDTPFVNAFVINKEVQNLWHDFFDDAHKRTKMYRLASRKWLQENYQKSGASLFYILFDKEKLEEIKKGGAAVTISQTKSSTSFCDVFEKIFAKIFAIPFMNKDDIDERKVKQYILDIIKIFGKTSLSCDIVLSIFCQGWPVCAREWITRKRLWPDISFVENILQGGFHIVPKSSSDGDFRLSFSRAETMLVKTLLPLQHKVMRAFKTVIKYHQHSWDPNVKEILSSYRILAF